MDGRPEGRGVGPDGRGGAGPQGRRFFCGRRPSGGRQEKHGLYVLQCDGWKGAGHGDGHRHGHGDRQDRPSDPGGPHGGHTLTETAGGSGRRSEHSGSGPLCGPFRSCRLAEAGCGRDAHYGHFPGSGGGARGASGGGDHRAGPVRVPDGPGPYHRAAAAVGGDSGGGECGLLR